MNPKCCAHLFLTFKFNIDQQGKLPVRRLLLQTVFDFKIVIQSIQSS
jgi:hypothetical protein